MSFPPATEMFQFAGFASAPYGFRCGYPSQGGLPHSEIPGSTIARISPGLFAACHVLHRLSVPRHPPDALILRLSATPNGKDHPDIRKHTSDIRSQIAERGKLSLLRRHFVRGTPCTAHSEKPPGRTQSPATVTQLASSRLSINNAPRHPLKGCSEVLSASCRVFAFAPGAIAFCGLPRKPLSARRAGAVHDQTRRFDRWR